MIGAFITVMAIPHLWSIALWVSRLGFIANAAAIALLAGILYMSIQMFMNMKE